MLWRKPLVLWQTEHWSKGKIGTSSGASFVVQYNPTITISGTESKEEFVKLLKRHKDEVVNIMKREFERKERLAY